MRGLLRIDTPDDAAQARGALDELEQRFDASLEPEVGRQLARDIVRLRMALTSYAIREQVRQAHDFGA
jgi:hypothetical protein